MIECRKCHKEIQCNIPEIKEWACSECAILKPESGLVRGDLLLD